MSKQAEKYRKQAKRTKKTLAKHSIEAPLTVCQDVIAHVHGAASFDELLGRQGGAAPASSSSNFACMAIYSNKQGLGTKLCTNRAEAIDYLFRYAEMYWDEAVSDAEGFGDCSVPTEIPADKEKAVKLYFQHRFDEHYSIETLSGATVDCDQTNSNPPCFFCGQPIADHNNEVCDDCLDQRRCPICGEKKELDKDVCIDCLPSPGQSAQMMFASENPVIVDEVPKFQPLAKDNIFKIIDRYGDPHFVSRGGNDLFVESDSQLVNGVPIWMAWPEK